MDKKKQPKLIQESTDLTFMDDTMIYDEHGNLHQDRIPQDHYVQDRNKKKQRRKRIAKQFDRAMDSMNLFWASACDGQRYMLCEAPDTRKVYTVDGKPVKKVSKVIYIIKDENRQEVLTIRDGEQKF